MWVLRLHLSHDDTQRLVSGDTHSCAEPQQICRDASIPAHLCKLPFMHELGFYCPLPSPLPPPLFHVQWILLSVSLPLFLCVFFFFFFFLSLLFPTSPTATHFIKPSGSELKYCRATKTCHQSQFSHICSVVRQDWDF